MSPTVLDWYCGRRVLVTGGLGFIGSNLVRRLVEIGADVHALDALLPDMGGARYNVEDLAGRLTIQIADQRDPVATAAAVEGREVIFNLAGQVSHVDSMRDPRTDLAINLDAQVQLLETCRQMNARARVVFASTRHVYGRPEAVPVDENHALHPPDVNAINKIAAEQYHRLYHAVFGLPVCVLRLTNVYGPRQLIRHNRQGFIAWFVRLAIEDREIQVFGDGSQQRDLLYVEDAVEAFLRAGASDACVGGTFNVGGDTPIAHRDLVRILIDVAGSGRVRYVDWPVDRQAIDVGSVWLDSSRLRQATGWAPRVPLVDGLRRMIEYIRPRLGAYCGLDAEVMERP